MRERHEAPPASGPAALFWAMRGTFSYAALRGYLRAGGSVRAVCVPLHPSPWGGAPPSWRTARGIPTRRPALPVLSSVVESSVLSLAADCGIEVFEVADPRDASTMGALDTLLDDLHAEVACVACWPWRIPGAVLRRFPLGVVNLHPSLLPLHRGPAPLFWTLRHGDAHAGVTVHQMDETLDTGPILARRQVDLPDGITGEALEARCADAGGDVLAWCLREHAAGRLEPRAQDAASGTYEPWPRASDFIVTPEQSARWAHNFICGAPYWGGRVALDCGGSHFSVRAALGYSTESALDVPWRQVGADLQVQCRPGVLRVLVDEPSGEGRSSPRRHTEARGEE